MSTIQLDFNLPERFESEYTAVDGSHQRPVMIHRASFGSIKRFFGVLTEHYAGVFPAQPAPIQVHLVLATDTFSAYCEDIAKQLHAESVRMRIDESGDRFGKETRNAAKDKVPFILIIGGEDAKHDAVSFRYRGGEQKNDVKVSATIQGITKIIHSRKNH